MNDNKSKFPIGELVQSASPSSPIVDEIAEKKKNQKKSLIKMGAMGILTLILLIFSSLSWFTMNTQVESGGMNVKTAPMPYEIAVPPRTNAVTAYDDILEDDFGYDTVALNTQNGSYSIKWVMNDETRGEDLTRGIRPGSYGYLTFYVIPNRVGSINIHFDLNLTGYYAEFAAEGGIVDPTNMTDGTLISLSDKIDNLELANITADADTVDANNLAIEKNQKAINYLYGHIQFFEKKETLTSAEIGEGDADSDLYYSKRIDKATGFDRTFTVSDEEVGQQLEKNKVTIYWVWANTFGQFLYDNGNINLNDPALFSSRQSAYVVSAGVSKKPRNELTDYIASSTNREYFFDSTLINSLSANDFSDLMNLTSTDDIITLSNGYNNADQVIGENVKLLLVELTAHSK